MRNDRIPFSFTNCNWYSALLAYCIQYMLWYIQFSSYFRCILVQSQHLCNFWWTKCRIVRLSALVLKHLKHFLNTFPIWNKVLSRLKNGLEWVQRSGLLLAFFFLLLLKNAISHWRSSFRNTGLPIIPCSYNNTVL